MVVLITTFGVISDLIVLIASGGTSVTVLGAFKTSPHLVARIFVMRNIIVNFVNAVTNAVLNIVFTLAIDSVLNFVGRTFNLGLFSTCFIGCLPSRLHLASIVLVANTSFMLDFLTAVCPTHQTTGVRPTRALHCRWLVLGQNVIVVGVEDR